MTWDIVFVQIALLANLMLRTVGVNLQDLFSSKHSNVFCKSSEDYSPLQYAVYRMLTVMIGGHCSVEKNIVIALSDFGQCLR